MLAANYPVRSNRRDPLPFACLPLLKPAGRVVLERALVYNSNRGEVIQFILRPDIIRPSQAELRNDSQTTFTK